MKIEIKLNVTCRRETCHDKNRKEMDIRCIRCIFGNYTLIE